MANVFRRSVIVVGWLLLWGIALWYFGVGGYRLGFLWTALILAGGAAGLAWQAVSPEAPYRAAWVVAAALVGLTVAATLVDTAPPSKGELASRMDDLSLPFFKEVSETRGGSSTCRPRCPVVERVYDAPDTAPFAATYTVALALVEKKLLETPPARSTRVVVRGDDMDVDARVRSVGDDVRVVLRFQAHR